jgi:hypothetical protein
VNSRDSPGRAVFPVTATSRKIYVLTSPDIYENLIDAPGTIRRDLIKLANLAEWIDADLSDNRAVDADALPIAQN